MHKKKNSQKSFTEYYKGSKTPLSAVVKMPAPPAPARSGCVFEKSKSTQSKHSVFTTNASEKCVVVPNCIRVSVQRVCDTRFSVMLWMENNIFITVCNSLSHPTVSVCLTVSMQPSFMLTIHYFKWIVLFSIFQGHCKSNGVEWPV